MDIRLSRALGPVKMAVMDTAEKAGSRRLNVLGPDVPCKPGCSGCCSRLIRITVAEGILIYEHLLKSGLWLRVKTEAQEQFPLVKDVAPIAWFKLNRPCPILDPKTRNCSAYPVRPARCSTHFVKSSPALCDPWGQTAGQYVPADLDDLVDAFWKRLDGCVDGYGILRVEAPIPVALLLAERVSVQTSLELDQAISLLYNELA